MLGGLNRFGDGGRGDTGVLAGSQSRDRQVAVGDLPAAVGHRPGVPQLRDLLMVVGAGDQDPRPANGSFPAVRAAGAPIGGLEVFAAVEVLGGQLLKGVAAGGERSCWRCCVLQPPGVTRLTGLPLAVV